MIDHVALPATLAVDIGGTKVEAALVTGAGSILPGTRHRAPTGAASTSARLRHAVVEVVDSARRAALEHGTQADRIGVGSAGPLGARAGSISPLNLPAWRDEPIGDWLSDTTGIPVSVGLDGHAIALAEARWGAAVDARSALVLVVSTGVGGGIVVDGRALRGATGNAGHIGHLPVPAPDAGSACACGRWGCVESVASGPSSVRWARDRGWVGSDGIELAAHAAAGDLVARAAIMRSAHAIGDAVAGAAALVDLDVVVIGGGFCRSAPDYIDLVRDRVRSGGFDHIRSIRVLPARLGDESPLVGAALLAH